MTFLHFLHSTGFSSQLYAFTPNRAFLLTDVVSLQTFNVELFPSCWQVWQPWTLRCQERLASELLFITSPQLSLLLSWVSSFSVVKTFSNSLIHFHLNLNGCVCLQELFWWWQSSQVFHRKLRTSTGLGPLPTSLQWTQSWTSSGECVWCVKLQTVLSYDTKCVLFQEESALQLSAVLCVKIKLLFTKHLCYT